jgi:hypothetical protein
MKYTNEQIDTLRTKIDTKFRELTNKHFDQLSNNEMAWLKCVSLSSIMTMKKSGYSNDEIMTTFGSHGQTKEQQVKSRVRTMTDDELAALGLKRI